MLPFRIPSSRFCGKYVTRSDTSARARRRAFAFGSFARNGLIGTRVGVPDGGRTPAGVALLGVALAGVGAGVAAAGGVGWLPIDGRTRGAVWRGMWGGTCGGIADDAGGVGWADIDGRSTGGVIGTVGRGGNADGRTGGCSGIAAGRGAEGFDGTGGRAAPPNGAGRPGPIGGMIVGRSGTGAVVPVAAAGDAGAGGRLDGGIMVVADGDGGDIGFTGSLLVTPDDAGRSTIAIGSVTAS